MLYCHSLAGGCSVVVLLVFCLEQEEEKVRATAQLAEAVTACAEGQMREAEWSQEQQHMRIQVQYGGQVEEERVERS